MGFLAVGLLTAVWARRAVYGRRTEALRQWGMCTRRGREMLEWLFWAWWRESLLLPSKVAPSVTSLWLWVPAMCVYLPKCHGNSVSITWKHPKCVFSFANSSLKNQRIEWWKKKLKTNPNTPFCCGTYQFWVMGDENKVMADGKHENQTAPKWLWTTWGQIIY